MNFYSFFTDGGGVLKNKWQEWTYFKQNFFVVWYFWFWSVEVFFNKTIAGFRWIVWIFWKNYQKNRSFKKCSRIWTKNDYVAGWFRVW